jgi:glucans biosynthesis protein
MADYRLSRRALAHLGLSAVGASTMIAGGDLARAQDQATPEPGANVPATDAAPAADPNAPRPFSFERLIDQTRQMAKAAYAAPPNVPDALANLGHDVYDKLRFRPEAEIWASSPAYRLQLFMPGGPYKSPVRINLVSDGMARPIALRPEMFDLSALKEQVTLPADLGFAGFRVVYPFDRPDAFTELLTFLGFSYFRALGRGTNFGTSARGLTLNTGLGREEEFPNFREFWIQEPTQASDPLTIFALLDSPSVAGAFRFDVVVRENTRIAVDANLFFRSDVEQIGIAPLTGMYFFGPNDRRNVDDYREAAYSTSGLSMWTGPGEILWRPFVNPSDLRMSVFTDENPRGFGMAQRPRDGKAFDDVESAFQNKPNAWVEPRGTWGKGSVRLIEIPTPDENNQNIVAFWTPADAVKAGQEVRLSYTLIWSLPPTIDPALATVRTTRIGVTRRSDGTVREDSRTIIIDYDATHEDQLPPLDKVQPEISVGNGELGMSRLEPNPVDGGWRLIFTVRPESNGDAVELRAVLKADNQPLSETWLYRLDKS